MELSSVLFYNFKLIKKCGWLTEINRPHSVLSNINDVFMLRKNACIFSYFLSKTDFFLLELNNYQSGYQNSEIHNSCCASSYE